MSYPETQCLLGVKSPNDHMINNYRTHWSKKGLKNNTECRKNNFKMSSNDTEIPFSAKIINQQDFPASASISCFLQKLQRFAFFLFFLSGFGTIPSSPCSVRISGSAAARLIFDRGHVDAVVLCLQVNAVVLCRVVMVTVSSAHRRAKMLSPSSASKMQTFDLTWWDSMACLPLRVTLSLPAICALSFIKGFFSFSCAPTLSLPFPPSLTHTQRSSTFYLGEQSLSIETVWEFKSSQWELERAYQLNTWSQHSCVCLFICLCVCFRGATLGLSFKPLVFYKCVFVVSIQWCLLLLNGSHDQCWKHDFYKKNGRWNFNFLPVVKQYSYLLIGGRPFFFFFATRMNTFNWKMLC